ncbi:MAG: gluconokinase [Burkholderiales bacterium]|nr:gluconokinase [Burkholderiales bacterium]
MGVSGSGKSTLGRALADALHGTFLDADDFHPPENVEKMRCGVALNDSDRAPWLNRLNGELRARQTAGECAVLACSALKARYRDTLAAGLPAVDWVFLDGDAEVIAARLRERRDHYMPPSLLQSQLDALERPADAVVVPITLPTAAQVSRVLTALYGGVTIPDDFAAQMEAAEVSPQQHAQRFARDRDEATETLHAVAVAADPAARFYAVTRAALAACCLERYTDAAAFAQTALELAPEFAGEWNYGNAIHDAHTALGLTALHRGDLAAATRELAAAGATPGSPQLDTFGPTMQLAHALLAVGERDAVLQYFTQCRKFWRMDYGFLDLWTAMVLRGDVPRFPLHLRW